MSQLPSVFDEIDRLFHELIHRPWGSTATVVPAQVHEVEDGWLVELPVSGMRAEDLSVDVRGRQVTIRGKRRTEEKQGSSKTGWTVSQRETSFTRALTLPQPAQPGDVDAHVEGSTLKIHIRRHTP
jgi:HSP20 family molecular chaperone IbpA